ncbi:TolC family protein [Saccharicrinis aurantiacus]|uniref:TolC family protein n=1 Tax=Saccharicrinis aurantiacus TaxID=1849719 RepID=UPI00248FADBD|nr:TolC family protein [Saccharicrinis aurantiacus]
MKSKLITQFAITCMLCIGIVAEAQEAATERLLSLEQAISLASANNRVIQKSLAEVDIAKANNQQTSAAFLPSVDVSSAYFSTNDPLNAFGFKLQQQTVSAEDFNPAILNNPGSNNNFHTQVLVEQPLINLDAWAGRKATSNQLKATEMKSEYTKAYINLLVKQTYFGLQLALNRVDVLKKAQKTTELYLETAENNIKQGYLKDADVMSIKVIKYEQEAKLIEAENKVKSVQESLNFLIGRDINTPVLVSDSIVQVHFSFNNVTTVNNRSDVLAMRYGLGVYESIRKSESFKFAPRINAFGAYNMYDADFGQFGSDSYLVGVKLQWRIFNGGKNIGKYKLSKANYNKAQISYVEFLDKGNLELSQAAREIIVAESQLISYNMASDEAIESLRIRTNRYKEGLEKTSDLLMAETKAEESLLKRLNAIYNYNVAVFNYQLLSSESAIE